MSPATAHWAISYPVWALLICATALPGLVLGSLAGRLARLLRRRPDPAYLGDWPDDYDMIQLAQLTDGYAAAQAKGVEVLRNLSFPIISAAPERLSR